MKFHAFRSQAKISKKSIMQISRLRGNSAYISAFTLIEMLMVIAIISILASILSPSLHQALAAARQTSCSNNEMQIGMTMAIYASDNNNYFPAAYTGYGADPENGQWTEFNWQRSLWPLLQGNLNENPYSPYNPNMMSSVLFCPSEIVSVTGVSERANYYSCYGLNYEIASQGGKLSLSQTKCYKITSAMSPSRNMLTCEVYTSCLGTIYGYTSFADGRGNIPHNNGGNFLYADFHVNYRKYPDQIPLPNSETYYSFWNGGK